MKPVTLALIIGAAIGGAYLLSTKKEEVKTVMQGGGFAGLPSIQMPDISTVFPALQFPEIRYPEFPQMFGAGDEAGGGTLEGFKNTLRSLFPEMPSGEDPLAWLAGLKEKAKEKAEELIPEIPDVTDLLPDVTGMGWGEKLGTWIGEGLSNIGEQVWAIPYSFGGRLQGRFEQWTKDLKAPTWRGAGFPSMPKLGVPEAILPRKVVQIGEMKRIGPFGYRVPAAPSGGEAAPALISLPKPVAKPALEAIQTVVENVPIPGGGIIAEMIERLKSRF